MKSAPTGLPGRTGAMLVLLVVMTLLPMAAAGCGAPSATTPTEETGGPSAMGTTTTGAATAATATPTAPGQVPDWTQHGFTIIGGQNIQPGAQVQVIAGGLIFSVTANSFTVPVRFDVLAADPGTLVSMPPPGMTPLVAFALRVTNTTNGQLIGQFNAPVALTALNNGITLNSMYYTLSTDGTLTATPAGMIARPGELDVPITSASSAWVIASPSVSTGGTG